MWKKAVPAVAMCSVLLVGCNMHKNVPATNETPMGEVRQGVERMTPNLNRPEVITPSPGVRNNDNYYNNGPVNGVNDNLPAVNGTTPNNGVINEPNLAPVPGKTIQEDVKIKTKK